MSLRFLRSASALLSAAAFLVPATSFAASWQTNVNYGANTKMDLYIPDDPAPSPPIVVALHYCSGMATNARGWLQSYADQHGFAIITPQAGGNCFDAAASRSGERANIAAMVAYVVAEHGADATRVFAVGASSGACMTQALLAAYPEVFAAGSSLAGVPAGAWTSGNNYGWSTSGTSGGQAWGDKVRQASPSFTGTRPRIQLWHGQGDTTLTYNQSYPQQVEQWTNVFGVTATDSTTEMIKPTGAQDTWTRTSYKDDSGVVVVEANSGPSNVPHDLSGRGLWGDVVRFFALDKPATGSGGMGGMGGMGSGGQATGGAAGTGPATGGMPSTGGMDGSSGTGTASGGASTGGTAMTGGSGGISSGGTAPASGGMAASTGGSTATGGSSTGAGTGGTGATGGSAMTGAGGMSPPSAGRSGTATGGAGGTGATGAKSGSDDDTETDSGCSIRVGAAPVGAADGALALLSLGALGLFLRRRRG